MGDHHRGGPVRLPFTIEHVSSEDPDSPARELTVSSGNTRGWQCARFCSYPQEITLRLDGVYRLHQIQLLSHEYKISTKIEVYTGRPAPGTSEVVLSRLGHLSFDSNEATKFQARELKSVHVSVTASALKLVLHKCHLNRLNIYNQVGIIAINVLGEPARDASGRGLLGGGSGDPHFIPRRPAAAGAGAPVDHNVDSVRKEEIRLYILKSPAPPPTEPALMVTAEKIRDLYAQKDQAVAREDFDEAKRLKEQISQVKSVGMKIAILEARKKAAIDAEDYDVAKQLKMDIEKLRFVSAAEAASGHFGGGGSDYASGPPHHRSGGARLGGLPEDAYDRPAEEADPYGESPPLDDQAGSFGGRDGGQINYDERPAVGKAALDGSAGLYDFSEADADAPPPAAGRPREPPKRSEPSMDEAEEPPRFNPAAEGFSADLPPAEPLSAADLKDARGLIDLVGEYTVMCLYSKNWVLREAAVTRIEKLISSGQIQSDDDRETFRTLARGIQRLFKDKVPNVALGGCRCLKSLVTAFGAGAGQRDVGAVVGELAPLLVELAGDSNPRLSSSGSELIVFLAPENVCGLQTLVPHLIKPPKNPSQWKPLLARLQLLAEIFSKFGVAQGGGGKGLPVEAVMPLLLKSMENANGDVRQCAIKLVVDMHKQAGPAVMRLLPKTLKPAIRDQLYEGFGMPAPEKDTPAAPAPARPARSVPPAGGRGAGAAGGGAPHAKPAAGRGAKGAPAGKKPAAPPPPPVEPEKLSLEDLELELNSKQKELGPDHPDVASLLTDIAALHSEDERFATAQPLYERALAAQEKALGAEHPDTVQTLTDLAICYLDQGLNEKGKPLLEKALALQEKALGPDHADVAAIRDVLVSLEAPAA